MHGLNQGNTFGKTLKSQAVDIRVAYINRDRSVLYVFAAIGMSHITVLGVELSRSPLSSCHSALLLWLMLRRL